MLLAPREPSEDKAQAYAQYQAAMDIFERRCVVCHGCYDAPCQLILSSFDGLARGANKEPVYRGSRLLAIEPTRLFVDGHSVEDWRRKGFFPVLQPTQALAEAGQPALRANLLVRMLELKRKHPMPQSGRFPRGFELGLDRKEVCPRADEFEDYEKEHPLWGMPYALPGLTDEEHAQLVAWIDAGAPHFAPPAHPEGVVESIARWEAFLNEPSLKSRLMARYIYEHLFLGSLYFSKVDSTRFFRLVRSRTPSGMPIDEIPTRRPFEDPGTDTFYYRFARREGVVVLRISRDVNARIALM